MMRMFLLVAAAFALTVSARAQDMPGAETAMMHDYVLTMEKVTGYGLALKEMGTAIAIDPALKKQSDTMAANVHSLTDLEVKIAESPLVLAFYTKHGLTPADAVLIPMVLGTAKMSARNPDIARAFAARISPAHIAFFKAHEAELKSQRWLFADAPN
jgi:hypothetical protein